MEITNRQKDILFALIEEYAELATPVGSVSLARIFGVSSATIRAEMAKLEELGLIAQPHTSAGRVPTDAGYRYYVNQLSSDDNLDFYSAASANINPNTTTDSDLDSIPDPDNTTHIPLRSDLFHDPRATHALEVRISSQTRADIAIKSSVDMLSELTDNLGIGTIGEQLYLSGIAKLLNQPEFMDVNRVQAVARLLDNLEPWLREASPGKPLNIFIGQENPIGKSSGVSLIISKFRSPFSDNSYIGVLGPTRQNYSRVMPLVRVAGELLEETLYHE